MAENETSSDPIPPRMKKPILNVSPNEASKLVEKRLELGKQICDGLTSGLARSEVYAIAQELDKWDKYNLTLLKRMFNTQSFANSYSVRQHAMTYIRGDLLRDPTFIREWFSEKKCELESIKEQLPLFDIDRKPSGVTAGAAKSFGNKVFLVHGHDVAAKESVARFLEHLDLEVVILHERPDKGRTIIEKLLEESDIDVGYAVVLLTPDDVKKLASEKAEPVPRARQNVILELGLFLAKLGKQRVHALYKEGVELPTDYLGVLYTSLDDAGAWRFKLARELKAVGFDIDLNKLGQ